MKKVFFVLFCITSFAVNAQTDLVGKWKTAFSGYDYFVEYHSNGVYSGKWIVPPSMCGQCMGTGKLDCPNCHHPFGPACDQCAYTGYIRCVACDGGYHPGQTLTYGGTWSYKNGVFKFHETINPSGKESRGEIKLTWVSSKEFYFVDKYGERRFHKTN